jgi:hypothetical protein
VTNETIAAGDLAVVVAMPGSAVSDEVIHGLCVRRLINGITTFSTGFPAIASRRSENPTTPISNSAGVTDSAGQGACAP